MFALDVREIYSFAVSNLLFEAAIWLAGKRRRGGELQLRILKATKAAYTE